MIYFGEKKFKGSDSVESMKKKARKYLKMFWTHSVLSDFEVYTAELDSAVSATPLQGWSCVWPCKASFKKSFQVKKYKSE